MFPRLRGTCKATICQSLLWRVAPAAVLLAAAAVTPAAADVPVDIRAAVSLEAEAGQVSYVLAIGDCTSLQSITLNAGSADAVVPVAETARIEGSATGCQLAFEAGGAGALEPEVTLTFLDATTQVHRETFFAESESPTLALVGVSLQESAGGDQLLVAELEAADDVDIRHLDVAMTGLRASALRAALGVVERAAAEAFAASGGAVRIHPQRDDQTRFFLSIPVRERLSPEAVARDRKSVV